MSTIRLLHLQARELCSQIYPLLFYLHSCISFSWSAILRQVPRSLTKFCIYRNGSHRRATVSEKTIFDSGAIFVLLSLLRYQLMNRFLSAVLVEWGNGGYVQYCVTYSHWPQPTETVWIWVLLE